MKIEPAGPDVAALAAAADFSFDIDAIALPPFDGPDIAATAAVDPPHRKTYRADFGHCRNDADHLFLAAIDETRLLGYLAASRGWNRLCHIEDLATDRLARGRGVGRALVEAAADWADASGLAGVSAETQHNNVGACRLYRSCGFSLGGADRHLYAALPESGEVALFWYRLFK